MGSFRSPDFHAMTHEEHAATPSPMERYWQGFRKALQGIHVRGGSDRVARALKHLIAEANGAGLEQSATCLENALAEVEAAGEATLSQLPASRCQPEKGGGK